MLIVSELAEVSLYRCVRDVAALKIPVKIFLIFRILLRGVYTGFEVI